MHISSTDCTYDWDQLKLWFDLDCWSHFKNSKLINIYNFLHAQYDFFNVALFNITTILMN